MSRPSRWPRRLLFVFAGLAAGAALALFLAVRAQEPGLRAPHLPALSAAVQVTFDARAVPTARALGFADAIAAQGTLHARERFFQMELQRRAARGELAELVGAGALPVDRLHRTYGFKQVAEAAVALLPPDERALLEAYVAGVNAWLAARPRRLGLELAILRNDPRPWTAADSLAVLLLMHEDLSTSWRMKLRAGAMQSLPEAMRRFLMPRTTAHDVLLVPDAKPTEPDAPAFFKTPHALLQAPAPAPADVLGLPDDAGEPALLEASNNWVIAGSRTRSGKPMLANDPHLALRAPGIWYALRLEWDEASGHRFVQGVSLPGVPGVVIGQNDHLAWGFTNIGTDVQDLFKEPVTGERVEQIAVRGGKTEDLRVPLGRHGPQVRPGYSLQWTALDPKLLIIPIDRIDRATDWKSFNDAFDGFTGPAQNVIYADNEGHIGWRATGRIPLRAPGDDGSLPVDGSTTAHDWQGFVPQAEMPRVLDPPQGYLVTANQRVIGSSFPHAVASLWASPGRARRISELIEAGGKHTRETVEQIQLDLVSLAHRELVRLWQPQLRSGDVAALLAGWDGAARAADKKMLAARGLQLMLREELHAALLGKAAEPFSWYNDDEALESALAASQADWTRAGLGDKEQLLGRAQSRAEEWLARQPRSWGEFDRTQIHHAFGLQPGALRWLFDPPQHDQGGCGACVRVGDPAHGQSMRLIVDWGAPESTTLVLPLGQSGHVGSPHRHDQQAHWLGGDPGGERTRLHAASEGESLIFDR